MKEKFRLFAKFLACGGNLCLVAQDKSKKDTSTKIKGDLFFIFFCSNMLKGIPHFFSLSLQAIADHA